MALRMTMALAMIGIDHASPHPESFVVVDGDEVRALREDHVELTRSMGYHLTAEDHLLRAKLGVPRASKLSAADLVKMARKNRRRRR